MKIRSVKYSAGYKISKDYQGAEGCFEATADLDEGEDALTAIRALRAEVLSWVARDEAVAQRYVRQLARRSRGEAQP